MRAARPTVLSCRVGRLSRLAALGSLRAASELGRVRVPSAARMTPGDT